MYNNTWNWYTFSKIEKSNTVLILCMSSQEYLISTKIHHQTSNKCRSLDLSPDSIWPCVSCLSIVCHNMLYNHCKSCPAVSQPSRNFFLSVYIILCACVGLSVLSLAVYWLNGILHKQINCCCKWLYGKDFITLPGPIVHAYIGESGYQIWCL